MVIDESIGWVLRPPTTSPCNASQVEPPFGSAALNRRTDSARSSRVLLHLHLAQHLGIAWSAVSLRMSGARDSSIPELVVIAEWLDISLADLLGPEILQAPKSPHKDVVTAEVGENEWALWGSNPRPEDYWVRAPLVDRAVILTWLWLGAVGISPTVEVRPQLAAASLSLLEGEQRSEQAGLNPERPADPRRRSRSAGTPPRRPGNAHAYPRAFRTLRRRTGTPSGTFRARRG